MIPCRKTRHLPDRTRAIHHALEIFQFVDVEPCVVGIAPPPNTAIKLRRARELDVNVFGLGDTHVLLNFGEMILIPAGIGVQVEIAHQRHGFQTAELVNGPASIADHGLGAGPPDDEHERAL